MLQCRIFCKTVFLRMAFECFNADFTMRQMREPLPALLESFSDRRPDGEPRSFSFRLVFEAERERGAFAMRQNGGEQVQFLRRHFRETVEPQDLESEFGVWRPGFAQSVGGEIQQAVRVLQFMFGEPA